MTTFDEATQLAARPDGRFTWQVPDGWQQGRGAWGGLVTGAVARAVVAHEPDPQRALRTVSVHMSGPVLATTHEITVQPVRIGASMSTWAVTVQNHDGDTAVHAIAIAGKPRVPDLHADLKSWPHASGPDLPDPAGVPSLPHGAPGAPPFLDHLELKVVDGIPYRQGDARCTGYVRFREQGPWTDVDLLSIIDAWWPTAWSKITEFRPAATVSYAAHLLDAPASVPPGQFLAFESFMSGAHEGFTTETRRLWSLDGRLLVENHQSIALIK